MKIKVPAELADELYITESENVILVMIVKFLESKKIPFNAGDVSKIKYNKMTGVLEIPE